ncbi:hypothetical protein ACLB2K_063948 [Fragaria x ananassa]
MISRPSMRGNAWRLKPKSKGERFDRNKVLRGGSWWYEKASIVLQVYDGVTPVEQYEEPDWIRDVAFVAGSFKAPDEKMFNSTGKFNFEHLHLLCDKCLLVFHENGICSTLDNAGSTSVAPQQRLSTLAAPLGFSTTFLQGAFNFQGTSSHPNVSRHLFPPSEPNSRKLVILKKLFFEPDPTTNKNSVTAMVVHEGASDDILEIMPAANNTLIQEKSSELITSPRLDLIVMEQPLQLDDHKRSAHCKPF